MKKRISAVALATLLVAGSAYGSGYRIPEQSVDSTGKAGANIASASRADATYFNPANMSWLDDTTLIQGNMSYIHLTPVDFNNGASIQSEDENFFIPTGFVVSPYFGDFRFGFSNTTPAGLAKRWKDTPGDFFSREFALKTFELNPTVSYRVNEKISVAGGVRMLYADADLWNVKYKLAGDTIEWGYNFALSVKPTEKVNVSATYRSNIDLGFTDNGAVFNPFGKPYFPATGVISASTTIPAPAVLALSVAFEPVDKLTVELTWDRTFWSKYESLDIQTNPSGSPFYTNTAKDWDDSDAFRIGLSYQYSDTLELMAGIAYDKTPIPDDTVSYELPDSDAWLYSVGFQYKYTENLEFGMAVLYDYKESRDYAGYTSPVLSVNSGEYTEAAAILVTTGISYKF